MASSAAAAGRGCAARSAALRRCQPMTPQTTLSAAPLPVADPVHVLKRWLATNGAQSDEPVLAVSSTDDGEPQWPLAVEFSTPGPLGLSLGPVDSGAGLALGVVGVESGGAAHKLGRGRVKPGLIVTSVSGLSTAGESPAAVMARVKASGRPLGLAFTPMAVLPRHSSGLRQQQRVLSDVPLVHSHLRDPKYRVLPARKWDGSVTYLQEENVDIVFVGQHIRDFQSIPRGILVNQFVNESCFTSKMLIQELLLRQRGATGRPAWLPEQYVLPLQLSALRQAWEHRQSAKQENSWIVRPIAGARSEGVWVTSDWSRLHAFVDKDDDDDDENDDDGRSNGGGDAGGGARTIVSKYVARPGTIDGRKFDLRFYVMVKRAGPSEDAAEVYCHKQYYCRRALMPWQPLSGCTTTQQPEPEPEHNIRQQNRGENNVSSGQDEQQQEHEEEYMIARHLTVHSYVPGVKVFYDEEPPPAGSHEQQHQVFYSRAEFERRWNNEHQDNVDCDLGTAHGTLLS